MDDQEKNNLEILDFLKESKKACVIAFDEENCWNAVHFKNICQDAVFPQIRAMVEGETIKRILVEMEKAKAFIIKEIILSADKKEISEEPKKH